MITRCSSESNLNIPEPRVQKHPISNDAYFSIVKIPPQLIIANAYWAPVYKPSLALPPRPRLEESFKSKMAS